MANYYVSKTNGSDVTGDGSSATPWLTIGKALTTITPSGSGDTVYVAPGIFPEAMTASVVGTATSPINVVGDVTGQYTGGAPGECRITAYTSGESTVPPNTNAAITGASGANYYNWSGFSIWGGKGTAVTIAANMLNWTFSDCLFMGGSGTSSPVTITVNSNAGHSFTRCRVYNWMSSGGSGAIQVSVSTVSGGDFSTGISVVDSVIISAGAVGINITSTGSAAGHGGGVTATRCTILANTAGFRVLGANNSITFPCTIANSWIIASGTGISAAAAGQVTDADYNMIYSGTAYSNVTAGTHSISDYRFSPLMHTGFESYYQRNLMPFFAPKADSPVGLLNYMPASGSTDVLGRLRPTSSTGTPATPGAIELHDRTVKDTATVPTGVANSLKMSRPYDFEFLIPVTTSATAFSVQVRWDTSYGGGTLPQVQLLANPALGVSAQTVTATGTFGAFRTITLASFTPTAAGEVTVRLVGSYMSPNGILYWGGATLSPQVATINMDFFSKGQAVNYLVPAGTGGGTTIAGFPRSRIYTDA